MNLGFYLVQSYIKKYSIWNSGKWSNIHFELNHPKYGLKSGIFLGESSYTIIAIKYFGISNSFKI